MASKINHVAIMSSNYALESKFYESMFGMKTSAKSGLRGRCRWATAMSA